MKPVSPVMKTSNALSNAFEVAWVSKDGTPVWEWIYFVNCPLSIMIFVKAATCLPHLVARGHIYPVYSVWTWSTLVCSYTVGRKQPWRVCCRLMDVSEQQEASMALYKAEVKVLRELLCAQYQLDAHSYPTLTTPGSSGFLKTCRSLKTWSFTGYVDRSGTCAFPYW